MSVVSHVIRGRARDLGGFGVRRVLPAPERRLVGPFIFLDHLGPATFAPGQGIDVRPHPHINLATVTYLFSGELVHRDTLGSLQSIRPGELNWMNAGRGIAHSERTSPELRRSGFHIHGMQAWVALPRAAEESPPAFDHYDASSLPTLDKDGVQLRIIAGTAFGARSPARTYSSLMYVDAALREGASLSVPDEHAERAIYVVEGALTIGDRAFQPGELAVFGGGEAVTVHATAPARVMLLGGEPMDGERHIWWNFVSSSKQRIEAAKRDWAEGRFGKVPGDEHEFIPLPSA